MMEKTLKLIAALTWALPIVALSACRTPEATQLSQPTAFITATLAPTHTTATTRPLTPHATVIAASTSVPSPAPSPNSGSDKIAFVSQGGDFPEIYMMNMDGSSQTNLTKNDCNDVSPAWSPDGTKIAFASFCGSDLDIYVMNADGRDQTNLTEGVGRDFDPAWSHDGARLAFTNCSDDASNSCDIYVMNADGNDRTRLTRNGCSNGTATWSSDGAKIAFTSFCDPDSDIYVMDADGSHQRRLINNSRNNSDPAWSRDGAKIAYISCSSNEPDSCEIYVMSSDGSDPIQLTDNSAWECCAAWSPDGTRIAFVSDRDAPLINVQFDYFSRVGSDIYVMNADGSGQTRLTTSSEAYNTSPSWSPSRQNAAIPHDDCTSGWTRLQASGQAQVSQETNIPNRVRSGPSTANEIIAALHPGSIMKLVEGPICADGLVFWKVENDSIPGGVGWTAEGDGTEYWLEPHPP